NRSFEFIGRFRIDRESDGVAITFHNDPNGIYAIGGPGGGIGAGQSVIPPNILPGTIHKPPHFEGISNGFMLELDTYMNDFWNMYLYEGFEGLMDKNIPIKKDSKEFHVALIKLNEFNYPDKPTKHNYETILSKELYTKKSNKEDKRVPFKLTWTPNISEKTGV
ncbi:lectin-like domain-containing protein, partial [Clostridium perfringens]|uniref:lectin-like domain-containing protein n=1 Tax=Clostridium perfringens TaxID=1502 RepID=UPI003754A971